MIEISNEGNFFNWVPAVITGLFIVVGLAIALAVIGTSLWVGFGIGLGVDMVLKNRNGNIMQHIRLKQ